MFVIPIIPLFNKDKEFSIILVSYKIEETGVAVH